MVSAAAGRANNAKIQELTIKLAESRASVGNEKKKNKELSEKVERLTRESDQLRTVNKEWLLTR